VSIVKAAEGIAVSHTINWARSWRSSSTERSFSKLAAAGVADPTLLFIHWQRQPNNDELAPESLDCLPCPMREVGCDCRFGREGEDDRLPRFSGLAKHGQPEHFTKANETIATERKHRPHGIDDQVIVEDGETGQRRQFSRYSQLSGSSCTVDED
jgi:hypothetical protein